MSAAGLDSVEFPDPFVVYADGAFKVSDLVSAFGATVTEVADFDAGNTDSSAFAADTAGVSTTTGVVCLTVVVCSPVTVSVFVSTS